jgi:hypothetical protein
MAKKKEEKEKPTWQDRAEQELTEFGKLGWKEAKGFGAAALHIAGVFAGFSSPKGSKWKK